MSEGKQTIGDKIRQLKDEKHLTNEKLASELGVSAVTISKWLNSDSIPWASVEKIAAYFGVSSYWLIGVNEEYEEDLKKISDELITVKGELLDKNKIIDSLTESQKIQSGQMTVLTTELSNSNQKLMDGQKYQGAVLLMILGFSLIIGGLVFKGDFNEPLTDAQNLMIVVMVYGGFAFFIFGIIKILASKISKDIHSDMKDVNRN